MDAGAFSNDSVVTEMNDLLCLSIDAESEAGAALAKQYTVPGYPTLLFLNPDGSARDSIGGYTKTDVFLAEIKRIKSGEGTISFLRDKIARNTSDLDARFKLIGKLASFGAKDAIRAERQYIEILVAAGHGFDPSSLHDVFALYNNLRAAGMSQLAEKQAKTLYALDPEGKSLPVRRLQFEDLVGGMRSPGTLDRLAAFLAEETHQSILFDGWYAVFRHANRMARRDKDMEVQGANRRASREAAVQLWKYLPETHLARLGNEIAWSFYESAAELTAKEKSFALEVARLAMEASDGDVNVIDTYACCLYASGQTKEALKYIDLCIEKDGENRQWKDRRRMFLCSRD